VRNCDSGHGYLNDAGLKQHMGGNTATKPLSAGFTKCAAGEFIRMDGKSYRISWQVGMTTFQSLKRALFFTSA